MQRSLNITEYYLPVHVNLIEYYLQITFEQVERFVFYERARKAFAVVHTGYVYAVHTLQLVCMERCCLMGKWGKFSWKPGSDCNGQATPADCDSTWCVNCTWLNTLCLKKVSWLLISTFKILSLTHLQGKCVAVIEISTPPQLCCYLLHYVAKFKTSKLIVRFLLQPSQIHNSQNLTTLKWHMPQENSTVLIT